MHSPKWLKISAGVLILILLLAALLTAAIIGLLWLSLWLIEKIAPML